MACLSRPAPQPLTKTSICSSSSSIFSASLSQCLTRVGKKSDRLALRVSCQTGNGDPYGRFDRRDLPIGLGGLYGASSLSADPFAFAAPIQAPDITKCGAADFSAGVEATVARKIFGSHQALAAESSSSPIKPIDLGFPIVLEAPISTLVRRPRKSRSKEEKEEEEEILVIEGIQFERDMVVKFDVYINDDTASGPASTEFAGSFVSFPRRHKHKKKLTTCLTLGITDLLDEVDADNDDTVVVTLVPIVGQGKVSIGGVKIEFE